MIVHECDAFKSIPQFGLQWCRAPRAFFNEVHFVCGECLLNFENRNTFFDCSVLVGFELDFQKSNVAFHVFALADFVTVEFAVLVISKMVEIGCVVIEGSVAALAMAFHLQDAVMVFYLLKYACKFPAVQDELRVCSVHKPDTIHFFQANGIKLV